MDSNERNLDNSLESAVNMTQEEIERLLAAQENQGSGEQQENQIADLESLLSELGEEKDSDIQEISDLLSRADNNEAVAEDVVALMQSQEADKGTAYDAMDLFSGEQEEKKEGFFKRLFSKLKKKKKEKSEEAKQTEKAEQAETLQDRVEEEKVSQDNIATQDNIQEALALLGESTEVEPKADTEQQAKPAKASKKKKKKEKKPKKGKEKKASDVGEEEKASEKSSKKKKDKKDKKEKTAKEKPGKEKPEEEGPIREKKTVESVNVAELLEDEQELPNKKKIIMVFVAAVMIMIGFLVVNHYYTGHTNKQLAEEAYAEADYLECYQLLYGQKMNDSQTAMFHRSELILKMDIFWNHYQDFVKSNQMLESLDRLVQFVYGYSELSAYASEWNCQDTVKDTYTNVLGILEEEYRVDEQKAIDIAGLEDDVEYTRALNKLVEEKQKKDALNQAYPDILPEEEDRITQN